MAGSSLDNKLNYRPFSRNVRRTKEVDCGSCLWYIHYSIVYITNFFVQWRIEDIRVEGFQCSTWIKSSNVWRTTLYNKDIQIKNKYTFIARRIFLICIAHLAICRTYLYLCPDHLIYSFFAFFLKGIAWPNMIHSPCELFHLCWPLMYSWYLYILPTNIWVLILMY